MKNIILHLDKAFFEMIKADKLLLQGKLHTEIKWEDYIKYLFGFLTQKQEFGKIIDEWTNKYCDEMQEEVKELKQKLGEMK